MGVSITTVEALRDAVHLRDENLVRLPDCGIAAEAARERRVVLTFDLDFGDILASAGSVTPSVVIFRLRNQTPAAVNHSSAIVIVEDEGYRLRRLPVRG